MLQYSPKIVTDSLVMCLDASNNKSYPTDLPVKNGLALWLDAADDSTFSYSSGTSVSQWRDKSGNNRHFFQATAGNQPSRSAVVNSRKAIQFTAASSQYLRYNSTVINNTTGGSVFVVWRTAGETNAYSSILDNYHCGNNALGAGFQIERNVTNNQYYWGFVTTGCANAGFMPATSYSNDTTNCIWITKDSTTITGGLNGTSGTPNASPSSTWVEDDKGWTIGSWGAGTESFGRFFNGIECEVIIFNRGLSPTEVKQVNTYLGQKWGISNTDRSIIDLSGNNTLLFGTGNVSYMPYFDFYNKGALKFDGSNDFAGVASTTTYGTNTTWEAWVNRSVSANDFNMFMGAYLPYFGLKADGTVIFSNTINSVQQTLYSTGFTSSNDTWYYLSFTTDYNGTNTTARIYINGVLNNSATFTGAQTTSNEYFGIGDGRGTISWYPFNGKVSNVKVYNRTLSAAEISQNYEAQKSKFANTIVQQGLVLNLDAGNPYSYAGAGTTWYDVSGNGYNGTLTNGPVYNTTNGGVIVFDGSNDYVSIPSNSNFNNGNNITVEAWVLCTNWSTYTHPMIVAKGINVEWILWKTNDDGYVGKLGWRAGGQVFTTTSLPNNTWVQCVGSVGGAGTKVYLNGVLESTVGNTIFTSGNVDVAIAAGLVAGSPSNPLGASVAITRIYNRQLTDAEVLQNYNATKGRFGL